jgi:hypothetical protein
VRDWRRGRAGELYRSAAEGTAVAVKLELGALCGFRDAPSDDLRFELSDNPASLAKLWGLVLIQALRDHATSVHFHPWRKGGAPAYVLSGVWYTMPQTIPPHLFGPMIARARALFTPPGGRRWLGRMFGAPSCGVVELDVDGSCPPFVWDVVVWSSGERAGVELFLTSPFPPAIAETPKAPLHRTEVTIAPGCRQSRYCFSAHTVQRDGDHVWFTAQILRPPGCDEIWWGGRIFLTVCCYDATGKRLSCNDQGWLVFSSNELEEHGQAEAEFHFTPPKGASSFTVELPGCGKTPPMNLP